MHGCSEVIIIHRQMTPINMIKNGVQKYSNVTGKIKQNES